jgi:hypothetical protein
MNWQRIEDAPKAIQVAASKIEWLGIWRAQIIGAHDGLYLLWHQQSGEQVWYAPIEGPAE